MRGVLTSLVIALASMGANAQIYLGETDEGSVVLSNTTNDPSYTLLIEAEKILATAEPADTGSTAGSLRIPRDYWQYVQEASQVTQVPSALIHAVIAVESNFNPRAQSSKGAQGLMQLMPATARRFGNTDRWDPRQNILAGSKYLRWLLDFFDQNLELALAGYNAGESAVLNAGRRIPQYAETVRYVPKVLSIYNQLRRPRT